MIRVIKKQRMMVRMLTRVRTQLSRNMKNSTLTRVTSAEMVWLMLICRVMEMFSTSLATRERMSPREWESKYLMGRRLSFTSMRLRMS